MPWEVVDRKGPEGERGDTEQRSAKSGWQVTKRRQATDDELMQAYVHGYNVHNPDQPIIEQDVPDRSGFFGGLSELVRGIGHAAADQFPEDVARIWQGGDVRLEDDGWAQDWIEEQERDRRSRVLSRQVVQGRGLNEALYYGPRSVTTSAAAGLSGSAMGGAAAAPVPLPGARVAGAVIGAGASSGTAFYRLAKNNFLHMVLDQARAENVELNEADWEAIKADVDDKATEYGLWEAGPEALSQAFTVGLFKGVGGRILGRIPGFRKTSEKLAKSALARVSAKMGAEMAEEQATEYVTYLGQSGVEKEQGLRDTDPSLDEYLKEQAGPVAVGSLLQGGAFQFVESASRARRAKIGADGPPLPPEPAEQVDLVQREKQPRANQADGNAGTSTKQGDPYYNEQAVQQRYTEEHAAPFPDSSRTFAAPQPTVTPHAAPFPDAKQLMRPPQPEVRPALAPFPVAAEVFGAPRPGVRPGLTPFPRSMDLIRQPDVSVVPERAPFDMAPEVMALPDPEVKPYVRVYPPAQGLYGFAPASAPDQVAPLRPAASVQDPASWERIRGSMQDWHASPMPRAKDLSRTLQQARPVGGLPAFSQLAPSMRTTAPQGAFRPDELEQAAPRVQVWPEAEARTSVEARASRPASMPESQPVPRNVPTPEDSKASASARSDEIHEWILRADGKPFPTLRGARSQAGRWQRKGRHVQVREVPGGYGLAVLDVEPDQAAPVTPLTRPMAKQLDQELVSEALPVAASGQASADLDPARGDSGATKPESMEVPESEARTESLENRPAEVSKPLVGEQDEKETDQRLAPGLAASSTASQQALLEVADQVRHRLEQGKAISWRDLQAWGDQAFGVTQAQGGWSIKEAYDAMELAVNQLVRQGRSDLPDLNPATMDAQAAQAAVHAIEERVLDLLPTQTRRTEEMVELQQFSTPPHLALVAAWVGRPGPADVVLEPSAGVGGLAVFAANAGAEVHVNELDARRRFLLQELGFDGVTGENAEQLHNVLPDTLRPSLVLMNPPFSSTAGRKKGERKTRNVLRHLDQALERLEPGGRLVAILPDGMSLEKRHMADWWGKTRRRYALRAQIRLNGAIYRKYGTTYDNILIVVDKVPPASDPVSKRADTLDKAIQALQEVRDERATHRKSGPGERGRQESPEGGRGGALAGLPVRPATGPLGSDQRQGERPGLHAGELRGGVAVSRDAGMGAAHDSGAGGRGAGRLGRDNRAGIHEPGHEPGGTGRVDPGEHQHEPDRAGLELHGRGPSEHTGLIRVEEARPASSDRAEFTDSLYEAYRPQRLHIPKARKHPTPLVQSAAMAAVEPPAPRYSPNLPESVVESGVLSEAQLEQVVYAGQAHQDILPDGNRRGYFVGDGTGVGKGRIIAGVILDNWRQGRQRAVWVSVSADLLKDAQRDVEGIGDDPRKVFPLSRYKMTKPVDRTQGILFTTYETLHQTPKNISKAAREGFRGGRLDQITRWLGEDFDGVVVFDESHKMGNAIEMQEEGKRGKKKPALRALAGVALQKSLPRARIVYVSATGATEPSNLSYAERMGLWGEGTVFANKVRFIEAVQSGGVAAMELVSRDLKAMGGYLARTLSYDGVTYDRLEHGLTEHQQQAYDTFAQAWQIVLENIHQALEATEQGRDRKVRSSALSLFWGNHQRFFNQVLTSMTMPSVLQDMRTELEKGHSCVVQLVNTNEASQERAMDKAKAEDGDLLNLDVTPRQMLLEYVGSAFPVHQFEEYLDESGNTRQRQVKDSQGRPVENKNAVQLRERLLERLMLLKVPGNPLDMIIEEFGPDRVAEVTGRKRRIYNGREQRRGKAASNREADEFMDGKRRVLVFSQAGGTGRSYHADRNVKNQQKRIHYILQAGWRADAATQGLGRTHRSNEAQPPHYKLVTTNLKGHKRFTSSIARRLDQLGALTQGQRQAGSQGLFSATDNLENDLAKAAWVWLCQDIYADRVESVSFDEFQQQTAMRLLREDEAGNVSLEPPEIKQFLNRLLSMTVEMQNHVFTAFEHRLQETYRLAEEGGRLDRGVVTLRAERIDLMDEKVVHTDERSGAETKVLHLRLHERREMQDFDTFLQNNARPVGWWKNRNSGRVYAGYHAGLKQEADGRMVERMLLRGVLSTSSRRVSVEELAENYAAVRPDEARKRWDETYASMEKVVQRDAWMITGMLLPVWTQISGRPNVYRLQTSDGQRHLGRLMSRDEYNDTRENLGLGREVPRYTPREALQALLSGRRLSLRGGFELEPRRVAGQVRLEVSGEAVPFAVDALKERGAFTEIIGHRMRVFFPAGERGEAFLKRMLAVHPLLSESAARGRDQDQTARFSHRASTAPDTASMSVNKVRGAVQDMQARAKNARPLKVVANFGDLPRRLRRQARAQGAGVVDGVYDQHEGVVWMVADAITSRKRAQEIWLHEQCAHRGLRGLMGDDRRFRQMLRGVYESAGGRGAFRELADLYGLDLTRPGDQLIAAEEYLARLAEKVRVEDVLSAVEQRVWRKLVRFFKELLHTLGVRVNFSEAELTDLVSEAVLWTFEGERRSDPSLAHDVAEWGRQLAERAAGKLHPKTILRVGAGTPDVFLKLGLEDRPLVMLHSKLRKAEQEHGLSEADMKQLPALLDAPVLVMDSASLSKTLVVVLDQHDSQGRPLVAAVHPDETVACKTAHKIASVYWKDGAQAWLQKAVDEGRVRYVDKKKGVASISRITGLQLPGAAATRNALQKTLLTDASVVKRDPDARFSIPAPGTNKVLDSALSKIGSPKTSARERFQAVKERFLAEFEQGLFDRFASLKRVDELAGVREMRDSAYVAARMTTSLGDQMGALLEHGVPVWRDGAVDVDGVGQGLVSVFEPVAGELDRWCAWMVGKRAAKLAAEGRENLFTPEEIQELQGLNAGREDEYDAVWRHYVRFKRGVLDFAEQAGVIDPEGRALWEHDEYIPFYRVLEEGGVLSPRGRKGIADQHSGIRQLRGGTSNLGDPFENIIRNFSHLVDAAIKNRAMQLAMDNAEAVGVAWKTDLAWEAVQLPAGAMQQALRKVFGDKDAVWPMSEAQRRSLQTVFHLVRPSGKDVVHVLRQGKPTFYQVSDPVLLRSLTAVNQAVWNNLGMRCMRFFKRVLTRGVTATPDFMARNLGRDTVHAWVVDTTKSFRPVLGSLRGLVQTLRKDPDSVHMLAAGASFQGGYSLGHDPSAARLLVDRQLRKSGIRKDRVLDSPHKLGRFLSQAWQRWEDLGSAVENATRAQVYTGTRKQGRSHLEAAFEAKDVMDYTMRGDWPVVRFLCETVPFFGARLTGLRRMGRGYMENPGAFLTKGTLIALASVLLYLVNREREEFQELEDWDRDNYYHFWLGQDHFRLPKPFEVGALFGTLPERITEQFVQGPDGELFAKRLWFMLNQTFSLDVPQVAAPLLEQWANKDLFTGRPIVGAGLDKLRPGEQRRPWTSATASEVARALDDSGIPLPETLRSPKRLEHMIQAYFGTLGMYALSASDLAVRSLWDYPSEPEPHLRDLPLLGSFYRDGPERHIRQLTELYELIRDVKGLAMTVDELRRLGEYDRARDLAVQERDKLRLRKLASRLERQLSGLNRAMRMVHADASLSPAAKRRKLDALVNQRNTLVKRVWDRVGRFTSGQGQVLRAQGQALA